MRSRALGNSGMSVSVLGLGTNNFGSRLNKPDAAALVAAALDAGVTFFDTADIYGGMGAECGDAERLLGAALGAARGNVVVATKFGMDMGASAFPPEVPRGSPEYVRWAIDGSLERLGTDHIDLYQYHEPDGLTPISETLGALEELVVQGKVRAIGCSNLGAWELADAFWSSRFIGVRAFSSVQERYHLLDRRAERELAPACVHYQVGLLPYYPLANGLLTGKYSRGEPPPVGSRLSWRTGWLTDSAFDHLERLSSLAKDAGVSLLELAIGGLAAQGAVSSVLAGAMSAEQVRANARAVNYIPTCDVKSEIDRIVTPGERVI